MAEPEQPEQISADQLMAFYYQQGRQDAHDHKTGRGDFMVIYAALMQATDGRLGQDIESLYNAWANDVVEDYILKGAPTPELMLQAQAAYQQVMS